MQLCRLVLFCCIARQVVATRIDSIAEESHQKKLNEQLGLGTPCSYKGNVDTWMMVRYHAREMPGVACPSHCNGNCSTWDWNKMPEPDQGEEDSCCCRKGSCADDKGEAQVAMKSSRKLGWTYVPLCCLRTEGSKCHGTFLVNRKYKRTSMYFCNKPGSESHHKSSECTHRPFDMPLQIYKHTSEWEGRVVYDKLEQHGDKTCRKTYWLQCQGRTLDFSGAIKQHGTIALVGNSSCFSRQSVEYFGALRNVFSRSTSAWTKFKHECSGSGRRRQFVGTVDANGERVFLAKGQNVVMNTRRLCIDVGPVNPNSGLVLSNITEDMFQSIRKHILSRRDIFTSRSINACVCCRSLMSMVTRFLKSQQFVQDECKLAYAIGASASELKTKTENLKKAYAATHDFARMLSGLVAPLFGKYIFDWGSHKVCKMVCDLRKLPEFNDFQHASVESIPGEALRLWMPSRKSISNLAKSLLKPI
eukprot:TRINITY_DN27321_c0_g1_i2.p1 TRINITY_DN27321_c0_g1~~TRINITY_DN27321_c0_g1_i2.p1  ORF type:complete len:474 (-),score=28.71 TRINITY_DN27321_c0_g1_i2:46-1467(-)